MKACSNMANDQHLNSTVQAVTNASTFSATQHPKFSGNLGSWAVASEHDQAASVS